MLCRAQIGDECGVFNGFDKHFPPGGNRLNRLQTLPPPFTGSANPQGPVAMEIGRSARGETSTV